MTHALGTETFPQGFHAARNKRFRCRRSDAHDIRCLAFREVFVIAESDRRPLADWKCKKGFSHLVSIFDSRLVNGGMTSVPPLKMPPLQSRATEVTVGEVDDGTSQICGKGLFITKVLKPRKNLDERLLGKVLSKRQVTRQEIGKAMGRG